MKVDLALAFAGLMSFAILAYVVLDGYDLGVGMLMPAATRDEQALMIASIGPFWDANETWLVLGVGLLFVAFPAAYGIVLDALYLPVAAMLIGLMFRGAAFEFRGHAPGWHGRLWNRLFWLGSFLAAFAQGAMLGRYVTGFRPGAGYWAFALVAAMGLCGGYVFLGATWLVLKTQGPVRAKAIVWARRGLLWTALGVLLVSVATPLVSATVRHRWFHFPRTFALLALPAATIACGAAAAVALRRLRRGDTAADWVPFACAVAIFVFAFIGLAYSLFPYVVIDRLTIWQAVADTGALRFVLAGVAVVMPLVIGYTAFVHRIFRGKVQSALYEH